MSSNDWRKHASYQGGSSNSRTVTRSQTGFKRVPDTSSNLDLFADETRHEAPGQPHLMVTMKGHHGNIPSTIITRSTGKNLDITQELVDKLEPYKRSGGSRAESPKKSGRKR